jgi:hypothetical protein
MTDAYRVLMGKSDVKKQLGIIKKEWEDDIKIDLKKSVGRTRAGLI